MFIYTSAFFRPPLTSYLPPPPSPLHARILIHSTASTQWVRTGRLNARGLPETDEEARARRRKKLKKKRRHYKIDDKLAGMIQFRLKAGMIGTTPAKMFKKWDRDGEGTLDKKVSLYAY